MDGRVELRVPRILEFFIIFLCCLVCLWLLPASFQKYRYKARASEALVSLRKIAHGAVLWYEKEHRVEGRVLPPHFPNLESPLLERGESDKWPDFSPCKEGSQSGWYKKNPGRWSRQPWLALNFAMKRAHSFQYTFDSGGVGEEAFFMAGAHADFDCDSIQSTYLMRAEYNKTTRSVQRLWLEVFKALE